MRAPAHHVPISRNSRQSSASLLFAACGPARGESPADAGVPAFPGAEGAGAITPGGRGGDVLRRDQPGRQRAGEPPGGRRGEGPRTVVFGVAGLITLETPLEIEHPFITIAGQTAPGDGVCIRGQSVHINTHDVVIRYMRFRRGNLKVRDDSLGGNPVGNVIIDHVSASWGLDENLSLYRHMDAGRGDAGEEAAGREPHHPVVDLERGAGPQSPRLRRDLGGQGLLVPPQPLRLQHRAEPEHRHGRAVRLPQQRAVQLAAPDDRRRRRELAGQHRHQLLQARPGHDGRATSATGSARSTPGRSQVRVSRRRQVVRRRQRRRGEPGDHGRQLGRRRPVQRGARRSRTTIVPKATEEEARASRAVPARPPIRQQSAEEAYELVLAHAGASLPRRDAVDVRVIESVRTGRPTFQDGIIDSPADVGGWPEYESAPAPADADVDGMPDAWETRHGLDPNDPADVEEDGDGDGYTSIEEYLNGTDPTAFVDYTKPENNRSALHPPVGRAGSRADETDSGRDGRRLGPGAVRPPDRASATGRGRAGAAPVTSSSDQAGRLVYAADGRGQSRPRLLAMRLHGRRRRDPRRPGPGRRRRRPRGTTGRGSRRPSTTSRVGPPTHAASAGRCCSWPVATRSPAASGSRPEVSSSAARGTVRAGRSLVATGTDRRPLIRIEGREDRRIVSGDAAAGRRRLRPRRVRAPPARRRRRVCASATRSSSSIPSTAAWIASLGMDRFAPGDEGRLPELAAGDDGPPLRPRRHRDRRRRPITLDAPLTTALDASLGAATVVAPTTGRAGSARSAWRTSAANPSSTATTPTTSSIPGWRSASTRRRTPGCGR